MIDILLALLTLGRTLYKGWFLKRIVSAAIFAFALVIVVSILVSALLAGAFYSIYLTLLNHGMEPLQAYAISGGLMLLFILLIITATAMHLKRMFAIPQDLLKQKLPIVAQAQDVVEAFMQGFTQTDADVKPESK